jgi:hypothetical protein
MKSSISPDESRWWQGSPDYHGTLCELGDNRLAVSPNGSRYLFQTRMPSGWYRVRNWRKRLGLLLPDLPDALADAARLLPDDPGSVERPWREEMSALSLRVRRSSARRDEYAGVIGGDEQARLVISPKGDRYLLQERGPDRWDVVVTSKTVGPIWEAVAYHVPPGDRLVMVARSAAVMRACTVVPKRAADYRGGPLRNGGGVLKRRPPMSCEMSESGDARQSRAEARHRRNSPARWSASENAEKATQPPAKRRRRVASNPWPDADWISGNG